MAILTLSREFGSAGGDIGIAVALSLNYRYLDKEIIMKGIRDSSTKWEELGKLLDLSSPTIWEKNNKFSRGFQALVQKAMLSCAAGDNAVIIGRGGNFLLKGIPHVLRVRITTPLERRIADVMNREGLEREAAAWLIEKEDRERASFVFSGYGRNWSESGEYDLIYNTEVQPAEVIIQEIIRLLKNRDFARNGEAQRGLEMRARVAEMRAELMTDPRLGHALVDMSFDGKEVVLQGILDDQQEYRQLEDAVRRLAGDLPFRSELHWICSKSYE